MKIAVTDACIFIDIIELRLTSHFFKLPFEIHTTLDVYNELYPEQQELLKAYQSVGKLFIYNITSDERMGLLQEPFPRALSENDKTVLFMAKKLDALVLSSDKAVRNYAKAQAVEYHGMLWIMDKMLEEGVLIPSQASEHLKTLIRNNIIYQNNATLHTEINKRIKNWSKSS